MTRGIFGDDERFRETYWSRFPGHYFAGDGARIDADGDFWLLGRVDDVMNVSGHRLSTIEVESALVDHPKVAEAAVCGRADATTGQAIVAYVTLKGNEGPSVEMLEELRNHVAHKIGAIAKPANIVFTPELPKTRSGKIMRRLLRDVAENRALGDTTTLADPSVVNELRRARRRRGRGVAGRGLDRDGLQPERRRAPTASLASPASASSRTRACSVDERGQVLRVRERPPAGCGPEPHRGLARHAPQHDVLVLARVRLGRACAAADEEDVALRAGPCGGNGGGSGIVEGLGLVGHLAHLRSAGRDGMQDSADSVRSLVLCACRRRPGEGGDRAPHVVVVGAPARDGDRGSPRGPSQTRRAHPRLALALHRGDDRRRPLVVLEAAAAPG